MAEQDRYGSHFGSNPSNPVQDSPSVNLQNLPKGSGAEQDRYGGWFGGGKGPSAADKIQEKVNENFPQGVGGAEQDRFGGWFGGKGPSAAEKVQEHLPRASGAEQDRLGGWFAGKGSAAAEKIQENLPQGSGAEQERYGGWFGGKGPSAADKIQEKIHNNLPQGTGGAEQDRFGGWFGGKGPAAADKIQEHLPRGSGAEQDHYSGWFGGKGPSAEELRKHMPQGSGAEQDHYAGYFGGKGPTADELKKHWPHMEGSGAEQDRYASHWSRRPENPVEATPGRTSWSSRGSLPSGAEQDRLGSHFSTRPVNPVSATSVGLLQSAVLPSFGLQTGLSVIAYGLSRYTDRAEGKDWYWPSGQVINAWYSAIGTRVFNDGLSLSTAWSTLTYPEKLLLTGVTAWGGRLFYRIATRGVSRGKDDPRYTEAKQDPNFWNKAFFSMYLPEAAIETIIALPFTLPFRAPVSNALASPLPDYATLAHSLAIFLFTSGLTLEVLADAQIESHRQKSDDLNREGVWSIVRHPNYLGDALVHASFPLLLYGAGILHPLALLGPVANYVFLRFIGGDKENEATQEKRYAKENPLKLQQLQEWRREKNSFWPSLKEVTNPWYLGILAAGVGGAVVERGIRAYLRG
ncbi:uncharacterized protein K452DRAFT_359005 [Aplosporella prunicola CBS 121167]|uniref:Steroid 5-alpha reductase C-terminal domain-containing protein n=1 Tax=Aplosporella prunicola CBS 121167 TaxID=1176127 RepID=A0A6A6BFD8_9PEZI|nr:uncharacterized protein K452DRAFT_359005 [Aplosporella prunicola CBS 121167]KAF2141201.1 hypothetical protein K452DRAFT_359005 [Aplosporella prunicola CBS 121167]